VIEEADAWVAFEVSSRQVQRRLAASASPQALLEDVVRGVVAKAKQLEATLSRLRRDESMLTGLPCMVNRRFVPVLVISEGFPLGPVARVVIDERLRVEGVLQDPSCDLCTSWAWTSSSSSCTRSRWAAERWSIYSMLMRVRPWLK
jgi:hypothetical protein